MSIGIQPRSEIHFFSAHGFGGFNGNEVSFDEDVFVEHLLEVFAPDFR
jgi:hypothetical protein